MEQLAGGSTTQTMRRRVAFGTLVGTTIEWYDYFIYGTGSALVFGHLFFPGLSSFGATLASFATFAVGFFARPFGSIFWGHFGDRVGRKNVLVITLLVMGCATTLIGVLPTANSIGAAAPILLVALRVVQGFGVAGEWGGAMLMAVEHAPQRRRGLFGSIPQMGNPAGLVLATGVFAACSTWTGSNFLVWGWRIPFLLSIVLVVAGLYVRLRLEETPLFKQVRERRAEVRVPIAEVVRHHLRAVLLGVGLIWFNGTQGYVLMAFSISYLTNTLGLASNVGTLAIAIAGVLAIIALPIFGSLSDRIGRRPLVAMSTVLGMLFAFPFFWLLQSKTVGLIILAYVGAYTIVNMSTCTLNGPLLAELFPTRVRYSGAGFSYNLEAVVGGAVAPLIASALVEWAGGSAWPVAVYLIVIGVVTLISVAVARETFRSSLSDSPEARPGAEVKTDRLTVRGEPKTPEAVK